MDLSTELEEITMLLEAHKKSQSFFFSNSGASPANLFKQIVLKRNPNILARSRLPLPQKPKTDNRPSPAELFESLAYKHDKRWKGTPSKGMLRGKMVPPGNDNLTNITNLTKPPKSKILSSPILPAIMSPKEYFKTVAKNNEYRELGKAKLREEKVRTPLGPFKSRLLQDGYYEIEDMFAEESEDEYDKDPEEFLRKIRTKEMDLEQAVLAGKIPVAPHVLSQKLMLNLDLDLGSLQDGVVEILKNSDKYGYHQKLTSQFQKCRNIESFKIVEKVQNLADTTELYETYDHLPYLVREPSDDEV